MLWQRQWLRTRKEEFKLSDKLWEKSLSLAVIAKTCMKLFIFFG